MIFFLKNDIYYEIIVAWERGPKHNIHENESFPVNWEYIKRIINSRMKWKPLESCRV